MIDHGDFQIASIAELDKLGPMILTTARSIISQGKAAHIQVGVYSPKRSTSAANLYWLWMDALAKHFSKRGNKFDKDDMHDLMRHRYLGYENRVIGKTELKPQLRSTTELSTRDMCEYMQQVDAWAADHGCLLPRPEDNDYATWQKAAA